MNTDVLDEVLDLTEIYRNAGLEAIVIESEEHDFSGGVQFYATAEEPFTVDGIQYVRKGRGYFFNLKPMSDSGTAMDFSVPSEHTDGWCNFEGTVISPFKYDDEEWIY